MSAGSPRDKQIRLRVAANLRHLMAKRGFDSERALARKLGVNPSTVSRALKADRCGLDLLVAVHRKLGVSLDWLVDDNEGVVDAARAAVAKATGGES